MKCYFLRHAEAVDGSPDSARVLSDHGRDQAAELGKFLKHSGIHFDAIFSSPLIRAKTTAEIVAEKVGIKSSLKIQVIDELKSETSEKSFLSWFQGLKGFESILLVSHEPSISDRVRNFLKIKDSRSFYFPTAGLVCLEIEDEDPELIGVLKLFITPSLIHKHESKSRDDQAVV